MPLWGLADPSPFVIKAMTLFKMANVEYETAFPDWEKAPRHKIPYITKDDGVFLGDTSFIKDYLIAEHNANFSGGYDAKTLAIGWAVERLCEDHLYWIEVSYRWGKEDNFNKGPRHFFDNAPEAIREKLVADALENSKRARISQGIGRFNYDEILELGKKDIDALSNIIGDNLFLLGNEICGYDAMAHAMLWGVSIDYFDNDVSKYLRTKPNLIAYIKRINELYYPEFV